MIETPAAALLMPELAGRLDFFSVGTNDLTQYTLAAERGNPALAAYADALHPAVLRLVRQVVECAHGHGKPVSVCGELASDPVAVPILLGLGVDELSVVPAAVTDVRNLIRRMDSRRCQALTAEALNCDRATQVRRLVETFTAGL
jgi:phosphocarrier protein FPr